MAITKAAAVLQRRKRWHLTQRRTASRLWNESATDWLMSWRRLGRKTQLCAIEWPNWNASWPSVIEISPRFNPGQVIMPLWPANLPLPGLI